MLRVAVWRQYLFLSIFVSIQLRTVECFELLVCQNRRATCSLVPT